MKTLGDVKVGESSTIVKLHGEGALRRHLMDLGLIKGTSFKVVKVARAFHPQGGGCRRRGPVRADGEYFCR